MTARSNGPQAGRQGFGGALAPLDHLAVGRRQTAGLFQHLAARVHREHVQAAGGQRTCDDAGTGAEVEHPTTQPTGQCADAVQQLVRVARPDRVEAGGTGKNPARIGV